MPAMPWYADAYLADTRHLTLEEHGAYRLLLDIAWRSAGNVIPDNDKRIAQMLGVTVTRWAKLKPAVMAFWRLDADGWRQKKLSKVFENARERQAKCAASADKRWQGKSLKNNGGGDANASANANATDDATINHNQGTIGKPMGGSPPSDPVKDLFDLGVAILKGAGHDERQARSLIGKWRKGRNDSEVVAALIDCRTRAISNPVEWIEKRFKGAQYVSKSGYEYRGTLEQIEREAKKRHDMDTYWQIQVDKRQAANA